MPHTLETERLLLRPYTEADIEPAYALLEGHPDVYRFDPGFARTREQRAILIRRHIADNREDGEGTLVVTLKESGQFIGQAGLQLYILPWSPFATPEVELYYKLGRAFWGQGYAEEACRALIDFAFNTMHLLRLVTITGGKLTTYREMAADTVDEIVADVLTLRPGATQVGHSVTKKLRLRGAAGFDTLDELGIKIVEGEYPGSTYYAAELMGDVEEANVVAARLGVPVRFGEISAMAALGEIAFESAGLMPELSYGSHFFQDLVESGIFYAAIFPQDVNPDGEPVYDAEVLDALPAWDGAVPLVSLPGVLRIFDLRQTGATLYADVVEQVCRLVFPDA